MQGVPWENDGFWWSSGLRHRASSQKILVVLGAQAPRELAENELKLSLSMGEMQGIPWENKRFWWSWGLRHRADSQKMSLS